MKHRLELPLLNKFGWYVKSLDDGSMYLRMDGLIKLGVCGSLTDSAYFLSYDQAFQAREAYLSKDEEWTRPTFKEEYTGMKEDEAFEELDKKLNGRPKQYRNGIDTFTRAKENMSIEGIMAATVMTVDAYIWRDNGTDYEDFCKARDWLDYCIKCMEEQK